MEMWNVPCFWSSGALEVGRGFKWSYLGLSPAKNGANSESFQQNPRQERIAMGFRDLEILQRRKYLPVDT